MLDFIHAMNETAVIFIPRMSDYGWAHIPGTDDSGYEAYSPFGEVKGFADYKSANEWRVNECKEFVRLTTV